MFGKCGSFKYICFISKYNTATLTQEIIMMNMTVLKRGTFIY